MRCGSRTACRRRPWRPTGATWSCMPRWLQAGQGRGIDATRESTCWPTWPQRHAATRATTANRRLSVFKRYCRWALREHLIDRRPDAEAGARARAAARAQELERGAGRSAAGRARRGHAAGPARPHDDRADVRQRPARERAGDAEDRAPEPGRRRAARHRQGREGAPGALRCRGARLGAPLPGRSARRDPEAARAATRCSSPRVAAR